MRWGRRKSLKRLGSDEELRDLNLDFPSAFFAFASLGLDFPSRGFGFPSLKLLKEELRLKAPS
jgi:hypothetical protein